MILRNRWEYDDGTYETRRLRLRSNAEDPRPGIDLPDNPREDDYTPVPWWAIDPSFKSLRPPMPALAGSRSNPAAPNSDPQGGAADTSAAGGPGRNTRPPAAHRTGRAA